MQYPYRLSRSLNEDSCKKGRNGQPGVEDRLYCSRPISYLPCADSEPIPRSAHTYRPMDRSNAALSITTGTGTRFSVPRAWVCGSCGASGVLDPCAYTARAIAILKSIANRGDRRVDRRDCASYHIPFRGSVYGWNLGTSPGSLAMYVFAAPLFPLLAGLWEVWSPRDLS